MNIIDHGIGNYVHSQVYIDKPEEVLKDIITKEEEIDNKAKEENMRVVLNSRNDSNVSKVESYENGMMFQINNTIPSADNTYDDFSSAKMYVFDNGEVDYVFDKLDTRIKENNGAESINADIIEELNAKLGEKKTFNSIEYLNRIDELKKDLDLSKNMTL